MAEGYKARGGASRLNVKVVGNPQPANPKENTIWLNTDRKITGYFFSATQPENMTEGNVWIMTGKTSTVGFSATKKNLIMVYPLNATQMVSGALVDVPARSYQNGEWVDWITYLYNNGDECTDITGGWYSFNWLTERGTGSVTKNADSVTLTCTKNTAIEYGTVNKINLSAYSKIELKASDYTQGTSRILLCVRNVTGTGISDTGLVANQAIQADTVSLDVSGLSGEYYVSVRAYSGSDSGTITVTFDEINLLR